MRYLIYFLMAIGSIFTISAQEIRIVKGFGNSNDFWVKDSVYLSYYRGHFNRSTDYGKTWEIIHVGTNDMLFSIADCNGKIYASGSYGIILKSDDMGKTWTDVSLEEDTGLYEMVFADSLHGVIGARHKIFVSDNGGKSWRSKDFPNGGNFNDIIAVENRFIALKKPNRRPDKPQVYSLVYSDDFGATWQKKDLELEGKRIYQMKYFKEYLIFHQINSDNSSSLAFYDTDFEYVKSVSIPDSMAMNNYYVTADQKIYIATHETVSRNLPADISVATITQQADAVPSFHYLSEKENLPTQIFRLNDDNWEFIAEYKKEEEADILHISDNIFFMQNLLPLNLGILKIAEKNSNQ